METVPCLLCGSTDAHPILRRAAPRHVICRKCGFVYQSPRPTAAEMAQHYNGQYWATHTHEDAGAAERANHIATWAARRLGPGALVCEIGCGPGHVLAHVQGLTGCRAVGVEPDPHMAESARARGLNVICGTLESVEIGGIDVLILSHVLEHFNDPLSALRRCRSMLTQCGAIWIEVPNMMRPNPRRSLGLWLSVEHSTYFSAATLQWFAAQAGLSTVAVDNCGIALRLMAMPGPERELPQPREYRAARRALLRHEALYYPRAVMRKVGFLKSSHAAV